MHAVLDSKHYDEVLDIAIHQVQKLLLVAQKVQDLRYVAPRL